MNWETIVLCSYTHGKLYMYFMERNWIQCIQCTRIIKANTNGQCINVLTWQRTYEPSYIVIKLWWFFFICLWCFIFFFVRWSVIDHIQKRLPFRSVCLFRNEFTLFNIDKTIVRYWLQQSVGADSLFSVLNEEVT